MSKGLSVTAGSVRQNYSSEPDQEIALVLVREYWWGHDWKKKGNISGNRVTFPLFQASGHCASSEAISATRKWVTIKEERYNQPSSSAGWFWLRLPYTVFFYPMFWLLWGRTEEFIKEEAGQRCPSSCLMEYLEAWGLFLKKKKNHNLTYLFQISEKRKQVYLSPQCAAVLKYACISPMAHSKPWPSVSKATVDAGA